MRQTEYQREVALKSTRKSGSDLNGFGTRLAKAWESIKDFDKAYPEFEQYHALCQLLWCLNAGGRRKYIVVERPDRDCPGVPRPDYVCKDQLTGAEVTVEVTRVFLDCEAPQKGNLRMDILSNVASLVEARLHGTYHIAVPEYLPVRGMRRQEIVDKLAEAVLRAEGGADVTRLPFGCELHKISDEGSGLLFGATLEEPLTSDWEIETKFRRALEHGSRKLKAYCKGVGVVLVDCFFFDPLDIWEGRIEVAQDQVLWVERLYVLNRTPRPRVVRIW